MNALRAFHADPNIKAKYLARVHAPREADRLIQGIGWTGRRGCAVGCTLESYDHERYPVELGIPEEIAYLEDALFEVMSPTKAQDWPEQFLEATPVGADLARVWPLWAVWMLVDPKHGVIHHAAGRPDLERMIRRVGDLYQQDIAPRKRAWSLVREAAARIAAEAGAGGVSAEIHAEVGAAGAVAAATRLTTTGIVVVWEAVRAAHAAVGAAARASAARAAWITSAAEARAVWVGAATTKLLDLLRAAPVSGVTS